MFINVKQSCQYYFLTFVKQFAKLLFYMAPPASTNQKIERRFMAMRMESSLYKRLEALGKIQKASVRSVAEQCIERGLPGLEQIFSTELHAAALRKAEKPGRDGHSRT
jgi:phosphoserine phosphatase